MFDHCVFRVSYFDIETKGKAYFYAVLRAPIVNCKQNVLNCVRIIFPMVLVGF